MNALYICLALAAQAFMVGGQLLMKQAMTLTTHTPVPRGRTAATFALAIALMTVWFFVWLFCKQHAPISALVVFEGVNPALLVLAAMLLLRERIDWKVWVGTSLIVGGILFATVPPWW